MIQLSVLQAVRRVLGRMHAREQEVSNALAETSTFVMNHFQVSVSLAAVATACCPSIHDDRLSSWSWSFQPFVAASQACRFHCFVTHSVVPVCQCLTPA
jgi:hypothetical protein